MNHKDRSLILALIGAPLLLIGTAAALLGPAEMYCFYLFSDGGRFHYGGFGFGSFMFGNIAAQIVGYYLIAIVLIPLGYGHLRARRWTRPLSLALLWSWLAITLQEGHSYGTSSGCRWRSCSSSSSLPPRNSPCRPSWSRSSSWQRPTS